MVHDLHTVLGLGAGVATSALFTLTAICFTAAGRRIGSTWVNALRIYLAIGLLFVTHRLVAGTWLPDAVGRQVLYLALSGVLGLTLGDHALFRSFLEIGPRLATLIMTTAPLMAVMFGWFVLGEQLGLVAWLGIGVTLGGVAWVVLERQPAGSRPAGGRFALGVFLAAVGAASQAGGLLLSKQGMGHGWLPDSEHLSPQAATLIRMIFGGIATVPVVIVHARTQRQAARTDASSQADSERKQLPRALGFVAIGALVGPYLGVWMSLVASDRLPLGIAQTLCSLTPIFILPVVVFIYRDRVSARAVIGACIAVAGAGLLFFEP